MNYIFSDISHRYQQRGQCASESNKDKSQEKALEALGGQLGVDHMIGMSFLTVSLASTDAQLKV